MNPEEIKRQLAAIREKMDDCESAYADEIDLYKSVLRAIAKGKCEQPAECAKLALRAEKIPLRWRATA